MRSMTAGGTGSGAADGGSSLTEVRCHAPIALGEDIGHRRGHRAGTTPSASAQAAGEIGAASSVTMLPSGLWRKFRPVRANAKKTTRPQGAAGCVILILLIMVGVMVFLYLVMKSNANG